MYEGVENTESFPKDPVKIQLDIFPICMNRSVCEGETDTNCLKIKFFLYLKEALGLMFVKNKVFATYNLLYNF